MFLCHINVMSKYRAKVNDHCSPVVKSWQWQEDEARREKAGS
jgi:hypothetical protein